MNLGELRTLTSVFLDDLNFGYFTTDQVNKWLNNAQREAQKLLMQSAQNYYMKCSEATLVPSSCQYYLPDDFLKSHRLEVVLGGTSPNETSQTLNPITLNQQDLLPNLTGTPQGYTLVKDKIRLFPTPDAALKLRLTYSYRVVDMSADSQIPDVPVEYHELIAILAARDGYIRDDRNPAVLDGKIKLYMEMMKVDANDRVQDKGREIVVTNDYYGEGSFY